MKEFRSDDLKGKLSIGRAVEKDFVQFVAEGDLNLSSTYNAAMLHKKDIPELIEYLQQFVEVAVNQELTTTKSNSLEIPNSSTINQKLTNECCTCEAYEGTQWIDTREDGVEVHNRCGKPLPIGQYKAGKGFNISDIPDLLYHLKCGKCEQVIKGFSFNHKTYLNLCNECAIEENVVQNSTLSGSCEWKPIWQIAKEQEGIMQPTEAIRWMRENPGKVIEAVEFPNYKYKWDMGKIYFLLNNEYIHDSWTSTEILSELRFFAYTYRIVEDE